MRLTLAVLLAAPALLLGQNPLRYPAEALEARFARSQPIVDYVLRVDEHDLSGFAVEMRIRNAPDTFRLAMMRHPEYDDRFWRYVRDVRIEAAGVAPTIARADSAVWRVHAPRGEAIVRYRIALPPQEGTEREAWVPFLSPTGGLVGGPHSFMYIVGATLAPLHLRLDLPAQWRIATGLEPTSDPRAFFAPTLDALVDAPVLAGQFRDWRFAVDGVPHRIVYWPLPTAKPFDTTALVGAIERMTRESIALFGRAPWREYTFILQDGAGGALEHANSVVLGAPSADLAQSVYPLLGEITHEFFHAWNYVRIRPAEARPADYRTPPSEAELWFSEGVTLFYSDLLLRRAGVPQLDSTRVMHLEGLIGRYLYSPGPARFSAERVSRVAYNAEPGALGDYSVSTHLQGELIGTVLDLIVRDATSGRRSLDDVMRLMLERYSGERGFTSRDVEHVVAEVCGCNVTPFFDAHVLGGGRPIDFDRYFALAGMRVRVTRAPSVGRDGQPAPDLRARAWTSESDHTVRLLVTNPASAWGRAGLHTGDRLTAVGGTPIASDADFRAILGRVRSGDTLHVEVARPSGAFRATVVIAPFDRPIVHIEPMANLSERQRALRERWLGAKP